MCCCDQILGSTFESNTNPLFHNLGFVKFTDLNKYLPRKLIFRYNKVPYIYYGDLDPLQKSIIITQGASMFCMLDSREQN